MEAGVSVNTIKAARREQRDLRQASSGWYELLASGSRSAGDPPGAENDHAERYSIQRFAFGIVNVPSAVTDDNS
jgi:hypothetical protein